MAAKNATLGDLAGINVIKPVIQVQHSNQLSYSTDRS